MKKIKLNLNQRKAISESINNLSVSIIVIGIVTPIISKQNIYSLDLIGAIIIVILSTLLFIFSNYLIS